MGSTEALRRRMAAEMAVMIRGDQRAVEFDGVLDDDEAVFGVLEGGDEEAADETEDEDVAPHDGVQKKV